MKIATYTISKEALLEIPAKERVFFLLAGHFANEIVILAKLLIITNGQVITKDKVPEKIPKAAELTQALFFNKMLAGKLYEGWKMIQKYYFKAGVSKDFRKRLDNDAEKAIKQISKYFGKNNSISKVRNSYSFHYSPKNIEPTIIGMKNGNEFDMFIAEQHINSLYYVSESIVNKSMLDEILKNDIIKAFDMLFEDITNILGYMLIFINNYMTITAGTYFVKDEKNSIIEELGIEVPSLEDLRLPFFVDVSSSAETN